MNARFDFNGMELVITDDGRLTHFEKDDNCCSSGLPHTPGMVGFQINGSRLEDGKKYTLCSSFLAPSHARAIASAMLSAAGRARD